MPRLLLPAALALMLAGCQGPISGSLPSDFLAGSGQTGATIIGGLQDAAWNLDQAVAVGALDAADPAPGCLHAALADLGIGANLPSFKPKVSDLISAGSIAYIRAQQAKKLSGGVVVAQSCKAIIGEIVLDIGAAGKGLIPGGNLLPTLK